MQINFEKFDESEKRSITYLEITLSSAFDITKYLNERDRPPFDEDWSAAFDRIEQAKTNLSKKEKNSLKTRVTVFRESIFKLVIKITGNPELAGYISDDFGFIFDALALDLFDPWIQELFDGYLSGSLPGGQQEQN